MAHIFYTLHDFMLHAKGVTYIVMGLVAVGLALYWTYFVGAGEEKDRF